MGSEEQGFFSIYIFWLLIIINATFQLAQGENHRDIIFSKIFNFSSTYLLVSEVTRKVDF